MVVRWSGQSRLHQGRSGKTMQQYEHAGVAVTLVSVRPEDQQMDWMKILYLNTQSFQSLIHCKHIAK